MRLQHALQALSDQSRSILSIALESGFSNDSSLTASMKKYCGQTPQEYRQSLRENPSLKIMGEDQSAPRPDSEVEDLLSDNIFPTINVSTKNRITEQLSQYGEQLLELSKQIQAFI